MSRVGAVLMIPSMCDDPDRHRSDLTSVLSVASSSRVSTPQGEGHVVQEIYAMRCALGSGIWDMVWMQRLYRYSVGLSVTVSCVGTGTGRIHTETYTLQLYETGISYKYKPPWPCLFVGVAAQFGYWRLASSLVCTAVSSRPKLLQLAPRLPRASCAASTGGSPPPSSSYWRLASPVQFLLAPGEELVHGQDLHLGVGEAHIAHLRGDPPEAHGSALVPGRLEPVAEEAWGSCAQTMMVYQPLRPSSGFARVELVCTV